MRLGQLVALFTSIALALTIPAAAATRTHRATTSHKVTKRAAAKPKFQSQRGIDDQRATELQAALIKAGYLSGTPSGHWDSASEAAMRKVQADNGWQTKLVPDSRAIIKLGLGPATVSPSSLGSSGGAIASNSSSHLPQDAQ
jgi:hypothetical protein